MSLVEIRMVAAPRQRPTMSLRLQFVCAECGEAVLGGATDEAQLHVKLFGLKAGWHLCRCGVRIWAWVKGQREYHAIIGLTYWPSIDPPEGYLVVCPPAVARGALTQDEWRRRR